MDDGAEVFIEGVLRTRKNNNKKEHDKRIFMIMDG